jgi:hypothetical protein
MPCSAVDCRARGKLGVLTTALNMREPDALIQVFLHRTGEETRVGDIATTVDPKRSRQIARKLDLSCDAGGGKNGL